MGPTFSIVLFFFLLPLVSAVDFQVPSNLTSGGPATISWSSSDTDPDFFSVELVNTNLFHDAIAIANNVPKTSGRISVTLPIVPAGSGYTIEAVDVSNINQVFGTSSPFAIGETVTTTSSTSTSSSSSTSLSSGSLTSPTGSTSTSGFGVTVTSTRSSVSSSSSSSTSPAASSSSFNGAPGSIIGGGIGGSIAVAVVGVIAGAVFI